MKLLFSPPWVDGSDISMSVLVKKRDFTQAEFFIWLFGQPIVFTSKILPTVDPVTVFKSFMAQPSKPANYYDLVLEKVKTGDSVTLSDLYGAECTKNLRWKFSTVDGNLVARLVETTSGGFDIADESTAKRKFCAELFGYLRSTARVVDETYSTSTQFAVNEVLTQLYACHLLQTR